MRLKRLTVIIVLAGLVTWGVLYILRFHTAKPIYPIQGEYIKVEGVKVYTVARGEGRTVLWLAGFPGHSESFFALASRPLPGYRFITLDFPGLGLSDKQLSEPMTPEALAITVKLFLDKIGVSEVDLVGHDLGGGVALVCASLFPHLVKRLVLVAPDSSRGSSARYLKWWWRTPVLGEAWAALRLDRGFIRRFLKKAWSPNASGWRQFVERYYRPLNTPQGRAGFLNINRARSGFHYLPYEERLTTKCLIIWGEQDRLVPVGQGEALARSLDLAKLKVIPQAGHLPQEEFPDDVYRLIQEFWQENPASGPPSPTH